MRNINCKLLIGLMTAALLSGSTLVTADTMDAGEAVSSSSELAVGGSGVSENEAVTPEVSQTPSDEGSDEDLNADQDQDSNEESDVEGAASSDTDSNQETQESSEEESDKTDTDQSDEKTDEEESALSEKEADQENKENEEDSDEEESSDVEESQKKKNKKEDKTTDADESAKEKEEEKVSGHTDAVPYSGVLSVPEVPQLVFNYSVKNYQKIKPVFKECTADGVGIYESLDLSSAATVAMLSEGAVVRLIDNSNPAWWFIETRDKNGRIIRGYAEAGCFKKPGKKSKEDPEKVQVLQETNTGFGAVEKTSYDELSMGEDIWETREDLVNYALQYLGNFYSDGRDSSPAETDFSGFAKMLYTKFGVELPQNLEEQFETGTKTKMKNVQPGDLIFYDSAKGLKKVVICLSNDGNGHVQVIQPSEEDGRIVVSNVDRDYLCRVRTYDQLNADRADSEGETIDLSEWTPVGDCRITSYCYDCNTPAHSAVTASGIPATEWHTVAVDSSVIPLGSRVYIEGYGIFVAEDTGVKGNWCDLYVHNIQCSIWDVAQVYYM